MPSSTTGKTFVSRISLVGAVACMLFFADAGAAQRVAVLTPDEKEGSKAFASKLEAALESKVKLVDDSLARSAFTAAGLESPYNLSLDDAKHAGQAIGCDFFVLVRSGLRRQSSFEREEYYDAYSSVFLVSSRTGRLIEHSLMSEIADNPNEASAKLDAAVQSNVDSLIAKLKATAKSEMNEDRPPPMEEPPDDGSPAAKNFRAPVPFRRLKPEYTKLADSYEVTATVDITVDLDAEGYVLRTETSRWAGYDLDGSVDKAIRSMNWRPAERDGKFIPMRFLVRYNFKKADKPSKP